MKAVWFSPNPTLRVRHSSSLCQYFRLPRQDELRADTMMPCPNLAPLRHADCIEQCPLSGATRKTFARMELFRFGPRLCENPIDAMIPLLNRGGLMKGFVQGADRQQTTLLPECLDDWVDESNPVRAVDVFVDALELGDLGFDGVDPAPTVRPAYHRSPMLKLYIYGYLNRVQSSRPLEREAGRNPEVMS